MALAHERLAVARLGEGRIDDARVELAAAGQLRARVRQRDDADFAGNLTVLGALLLERGLADEAAPRLRQAVALYARLRGPDRADVALVEVFLAAALRRAGDPAATELMRDACDRSQRTWSSDHPNLAHARLVCGEDALQAGDPARALTLLRAALQPGAGALTLERRGRARFALARALAAGGQLAEARTLAGQARADVAAATSAPPALRAEIEAWLAKPATIARP
jgi:hypothetical protein